MKDALAYAKERDIKRKELLKEMTKEAVLNGGYDKVQIPPGGEDELDKIRIWKLTGQAAHMSK